MTTTIINRVVTTEVVSTSKAVDLTSTDIVNHINQLNEVRRTLRALEAQEKEVKKIIFDLMGEAKEGIINGVPRVFLQEVPRTDIDREKLKTNFSEVWEAVSYANPYIKLVTK
jgi:predicted phage-related endonuclease